MDISVENLFLDIGVKMLKQGYERGLSRKSFPSLIHTK